MIDKREPERPPFVVYASALGLGGLLLALQGANVEAQLLRSSFWSVIFFALLIGLAWRFPFSILPRSRMSIDYVFLIAALAVLPAPLPYLVGVGAAILGGVLRRGRTPGSWPGPALTAFNLGVLFTTIGAGSL